MDPKNKFDEKLKNLFDQHSEPAPESVWEKIMEVRKDRKRAGFLSGYRWLLLLLLIPVGSGIYFISQPGENKNEIIADKELPGASNNSPVNSHDQINNSEGQPVQGNSEINKNEQAATQNIPVKENPVITKSKTGGIMVAVNTPVSEQEGNDENSNATANPDELALAITTDAASDEENNLNEIAAVNATVSSQLAADSLTSEQEEKEESTVKENVDEKIKIPPPASTNFFSVEVYVLPEYAIRHMSEKPSQNVTDHLNRRMESETRDNAISAGFNLRYEINQHYFVRAGIRYSQINEKFFATRTNIIETIGSIDSTIKGYIIDPFLPPVPYYGIDTTFAYVPYYFVEAAANRYTFIDIPVSAGVQFKFKQLDLYISAGVEFNISSSASGKIISPDTLYLLDLSNPQQTPVKNNASLSVQTSFGCAYHMTKRFDFILEPCYRHQLGTFTKNEYPLNHSYSRLGIIAGVKYNIR